MNVIIAISISCSRFWEVLQYTEHPSNVRYCAKDTANLIIAKIEHKFHVQIFTIQLSAMRIIYYRVQSWYLTCVLNRHLGY